MEKLLKACLLVAVGSVACPETARANIVAECATSLQPSVLVSDTDYVGKLSYLNLINRSNFEAYRKSGLISSILDGISNSASYEEFEQRRSTYQQQVQVDYTSRESASVISRTLSKEAAHLFKECVDTVMNSLAVRLELLDNDLRTPRVRVHFNGVLPTQVFNVTTSIRGGKIVGTKPKQTWKGRGSDDFAIKRDVAGEPVFVAIAATSGGRPRMSDSLMIPKFIAFTKTDTLRTERTPSSTGNCGGYGSGANTRGTSAAIILTNPADTFQSQPWSENVRHGLPGRAGMEIEHSSPMALVAAVTCAPGSKDQSIGATGQTAVQVRTVKYQRATDLSAVGVLLGETQ